MSILTVTELEKLMDPCAEKHRGNSESREANRRNLRVRDAQRQQIYELLKAEPRTMKEISAAMGVPFNACSGRGSELKHMGLVEETGERRGGGAVLRVVEGVSYV